jgi:dihydroorotase
MYPYDFWATYLGSTRFAPGWEERFHITYDDLVVPGSGQHLDAASFERERADNTLVAALAIPEGDVVAGLRSPFVMIGSDAVLEEGDNNHPRGAGCFSRVLGRYVRDQQVLDLRSALAKMTVIPAQRLVGGAPAFARKGRLQVGADADVTVFDPATVADRATIEDPSQESVGIPWVLVGGKVVKSPDGVQRDVRPGRALRRGGG